MTVRELIEALLYFDMDHPVVLASDEEGNELRVLDTLGPDTFTEDDELPFIGRGVVLWP